MKPLTVSKPFPTTDGILPDYYSLKIISPAYASAQSELNTILQYNYHGYFIKALGFKKYAEVLQSVAICEMLHLKLLGETILALGAQPIYAHNPPCAYNFYSSKFVSYSTSPVHIFEDNVRAEYEAVKGYKKMICNLKNEQVKSIISRILEDEELHLQTFKEILYSLKG